MSGADLVVLQNSRPLIVVEAKGRAISAPFKDAVMAQLRGYVEDTGSRWAVLADPEQVLIFDCSADLEEPIARFPTSDALDSVGVPSGSPIGERVLLVAVEHWLRRTLPTNGHARDPRLHEFVEALKRADEFATEYAVA